jgi:hypothetical protein
VTTEEIDAKNWRGLPSQQTDWVIRGHTKNTDRSKENSARVASRVIFWSQARPMDFQVLLVVPSSSDQRHGFTWRLQPIDIPTWITFLCIMTSIAAPSNTIYVKNIDWKIKKPLLRRALYSLFSRHGKVSSSLQRVLR